MPSGLPILPPTPIDVIIAHAVQFEFLVGGSGVLANRYDRQLADSSLPIVRATALWPTFYRAASEGITRGAVSLIASTDAAMSDFAETSGTEVNASRPYSAGVVRMMFIACCMMPGLRGVLNEELIHVWREEADNACLGEVLHSTFESIDALFVNGTLDVIPAMQGEHGNIHLQVLGTIYYVSTRQVSVDGWFRIHSVWANFFGAFPHRALAGEFFLRLLKEHWGKMVSQRFALVAPAVNAPALEAALHVHGTPWQQVRAIMLAAEAASGATLVSSVRATLDELGGA
jgi:hypothetical protein